MSIQSNEREPKSDAAPDTETQFRTYDTRGRWSDEHFSGARRRDLASLYNWLAPNYDWLQRLWLRLAGGEAQSALEAAVRVLLTPNTDLLDAGCGTGAFARALISEGMAPARITLVDPSEKMLVNCDDLSVTRVQGRLEALPFENTKFDIVTCVWALETSADPELSLFELCRVVRPGGWLCLTFCADVPSRSLGGWMARHAVSWSRTGQFLPVGDVVSLLQRTGEFVVSSTPTHGPACTLMARRVEKPDPLDQTVDVLAEESQVKVEMQSLLTLQK